MLTISSHPDPPSPRSAPSSSVLAPGNAGILGEVGQVLQVEGHHLGEQAAFKRPLCILKTMNMLIDWCLFRVLEILPYLFLGPRNMCID